MNFKNKGKTSTLKLIKHYIVDSVKAQTPAKCCSVLNNFLKCGRTSVLVGKDPL